MIKSKIHLWPVITGFCIVTSCTGIKNEQLRIQLEKSNCNQQNIYSYSKQEMPVPLNQINLDSALTEAFSRKSLNMANSINAIDLLKEYLAIRKSYRQYPTTEKRLDLLECAQKINQRISISSLEISAVASEMDCEEERADQIAGYLKGKEDNIETKLTVGGLLIGGTGAVASGFLVNKGNAGDYIGVGTGIAGAVAGLLILTSKKKIEFHHKRNALHDIWQGGETSTNFPPSVWYYLNYNDDSQIQGSLREITISKWMNLGQVSGDQPKDKQRNLDLYFGAGGKYSAEQLRNRADMLDQVESLVNLMKQDLKELAIEFDNLQRHYQQ